MPAAWSYIVWLWYGDCFEAKSMEREMEGRKSKSEFSVQYLFSVTIFIYGGHIDRMRLECAMIHSNEKRLYIEI